MTETEGNSVFCGPETVDVSRGEAEGNIDGRGSTKHTAFPRSQSISDKYQHEWKLEKREIVWKHDARRTECFHTISSFSNFHEC